MHTHRCILHPYTTLFRSRQPVPIHASASGKVIASQYEDTPRRRLLSSSPLKEFTPHTLTDPAELERSEEHTSELQSRGHIVFRLLLENIKKSKHTHYKNS